MPMRGHPGFWLRSSAAVAASVLALASTGALVASAMVAPGASGPAVVLADHSKANGDGNGQSASGEDNKGDGKSHSQPESLAAWLAQIKAEQDKSKPKTAPAVANKAAAHTDLSKSPSSQHVTAAGAPATPAPTARVVVDSSDPAPFSTPTPSPTTRRASFPWRAWGR